MTDAERRADHARQLLDDPVLKDAWAKIEAVAYEQLLATEDDNKRRRLADRINTIRDLKAQLRLTVTQGTAREAPTVA